MNHFFREQRTSGKDFTQINIAKQNRVERGVMPELSHAGGVLGGAGGLEPPPPQFLAEQLTRGAYYTHHSTTSPPGFSDLNAGKFCNS